MAWIRGDSAVWVGGAIALLAALLGFATLSTPAAYAQGTSVVDVAAGNEHTCVLLDDAKVRCNPAQIGATESPGIFGPVDLGNRPTEEITAGAGFTCARADDGSVRCWNSTGPAATSTVDLGAGRSAAAISAGASHVCAILDNGKVRCWGANGSGQLGRGNTEPVAEPGSVPPVDLGFQRTAVEVSAGGQHTCAILDNGRTLCWGSNQNGQLGYPNPRPELGNNIGDDEMPADAGPVDYGGAEATSISAGSSQTCALLDDDSVRCWGNGANGRLGYGGTAPVDDPAAAPSLGLAGPAAEVETQDRHTCARLADGSLSCWGFNQNGQLGYANTLTDATMPSPGGPIDFGPGRSVSGFAVGGQHTCAVLDNGELKCWGFGEGGRLGYGSDSFDDVGDDETPAMVDSIDATDRPPTAIADSFAVDEDAAATSLAVLANDTDVDLGPKQILSAGDPAGGTVAITGGGSGLTYRPDPDYCNTPGGAPDTFGYTITGGSSATVSVAVDCVDEPAPPASVVPPGAERPPESGTEQDTTAPETSFKTTPKDTTRTKKKRAKLRFEFAANEDVSKFECRVNGARFERCSSPLTLKAKRGTHYLDVRAFDLAGNVDRTPARYAFQVVKKRG